MRWIRLLLAVIKAKQRASISVREESVYDFRVWVTDIDVSIMNHAALLTVMEAGRIDLMIRSGFWKLARSNRWYFVSAAVNAQFLRPMKMFQKGRLVTRVFHIEDPWIYIEHKVISMGKEVAFGMVKSKVKKGRENVTTKDILQALGAEPVPAEAGELTQMYEAVNKAAIQRWQEGEQRTGT